MFLNKIVDNYKTHDLGISLHDGIPKMYYNLKDKKFNDWEIPPWELYIFTYRKLGEGTFSDVYLAKWRETFVVAKVIKREILQIKQYLILREIDIMTKLHHPNIVQFLGYIDEPFIIVMEYIPSNNLKHNINLLSKSQKISVMKDILKGLIYIHNRKPFSLIHRDIKPSNILLTKSKVAKITDFGLSKFYNFIQNQSFNNLDGLINNIELTNNVGTEQYMAPEIKNDTDITDYTNKIDIYSTGIMLYELFENKKYNEKSIKWYWTPKKIRDIIKKMVLLDPDERPSAISILQLINDIY